MKKVGEEIKALDLVAERFRNPARRYQCLSCPIRRYRMFLTAPMKAPTSRCAPGVSHACSISSPGLTGTWAPSWALSIRNVAPRSPNRASRCLRGMGARLERSLINFFLNLHTGEHGYTELFPADPGQQRQYAGHRPAVQVRPGRDVQAA